MVFNVDFERTISEQGIELVGYPVGSEEFQKQFVNSKVQEVLAVVEKIHQVHELGRFQTARRSPQALYRLTRLCIKQRLTHIPRGVNPKLCKEGFGLVDKAEAGLGRGIGDHEQDGTIELRMELPFRFRWENWMNVTLLECRKLEMALMSF
jgi:hypothetical protein